jgi:hypothetical protein
VLEDQLDRFVDPAMVREKLLMVAAKAKSALVLNADDQNILLIDKEIDSKPVSWFGVKSSLISNTEHGLGNAPTYLAELSRPLVQTEVIEQSPEKTTVRVLDQNVSFALPTSENFIPELAARTLEELPPVFARGEITTVNGVDVEFILVQNPMSFQLNLDNLPPDQEQVMVAIGRDVHDPSWLWTVDMKNMPAIDIVTGFNYAEMALRLAYDEIPVGEVVPELEDALAKFFGLPAPKSGRRTVIFSADAMRRTRRALGFVDPEAVER